MKSPSCNRCTSRTCAWSSVLLSVSSFVVKSHYLSWLFFSFCCRNTPSWTWLSLTKQFSLSYFILDEVPSYTFESGFSPSSSIHYYCSHQHLPENFKVLSTLSISYFPAGYHEQCSGHTGQHLAPDISLLNYCLNKTVKKPNM